MRSGMTVALVVAFLTPAVWAEDLPSAAEAKAQMTEQLVEVLSKTRSTDTFLVTLALLVESKADPRVIPVVLQHAERLGIFDDHLGDETPKARLADEVKDMVLMIQKPGSRNSARARYGPSCNPPPAVGSSSSYKPVDDNRSPLQPPVKPGEKLPPVAPPSEAEILRSLRGADVRDNVTIVAEKITDKLDEPRVFPLVGAAQLRHVHYKCTVTYTTQGKPRVEVVYIDKDQLHACR